MGPANMRLAERAKSIFDQLGYDVEGDGPEFRAERAWKVVEVTATTTAETPESGSMRCFVTDEETATTLRRRLRRDQPDYEWAIISILDEEDYEVVRAPPTPAV